MLLEMQVRQLGSQARQVAAGGVASKKAKGQEQSGATLLDKQAVQTGRRLVESVSQAVQYWPSVVHSSKQTRGEVGELLPHPGVQVQIIGSRQSMQLPEQVWRILRVRSKLNRCLLEGSESVGVAKDPIVKGRVERVFLVEKLVFLA